MNSLCTSKWRSSPRRRLRRACGPPAGRAGGRPAAQLPPPCARLTAALPSSGTGAVSPLASFSLGLLLVMATAFPTPVPLGEDPKDALTSHRPPLTSQNQTENLIKSIFFEISEVRNKVGKLQGGR